MKLYQKNWIISWHLTYGNHNIMPVKHLGSTPSFSSILFRALLQCTMILAISTLSLSQSNPNI